MDETLTRVAARRVRAGRISMWKVRVLARPSSARWIPSCSASSSRPSPSNAGITLARRDALRRQQPPYCVETRLAGPGPRAQCREDRFLDRSGACALHHKGTFEPLRRGPGGVGYSSATPAPSRLAPLAVGAARSGAAAAALIASVRQRARQAGGERVKASRLSQGTAQAMQTFTVHEPPNAPADRVDRAEGLLFIKDGFSGARPCSGRCGLAHRLWWLAAHRLYQSPTALSRRCD